MSDHVVRAGDTYEGVESLRLEAVGVTTGYGRKMVVHDADLAVAAGSVTVIIGPNGSGKSTLLRALARLLPLKAGTVRIDGDDLGALATREIARRMTLLPQSPVAPEGLTVADLVARGRHPHQSWWRQWADADEAIIGSAMERTGVLDLAAQPLDQLSGGQQQRAWIAMALAQATPTVLLDEPTTHLDLAHAVEVLDLVRELCHDDGRTAVIVLHDLNLAALYADQLVIMSGGRVATTGAPAEVISTEMLLGVFGLHAQLLPGPTSGAPVIAPLPRPVPSG